MKFVEPIREMEKIEEIKILLEEKWNVRDLLMFVAGINFALRIEDLLKITVGDIFEDGAVKDFFDIVEGKTKKENRIFVTDSVKKVLKEYILKYPYVAVNPGNFLFFTNDGRKSISRRQALNIMHTLTKKVWLQGRYWTHTLRKTWGYQARKKWVAIELIQNKLNHSSQKVTERYLWITQQEVWEACLDLNL